MIKIEDIGVEMAAQSNRHTQFPMFAIQVDVKRYVDSRMGYDGSERSEDGICDICADLDDERPTECDDCEWVYYQIEQQFELEPGIFFTAKACQEHIDANHYHYSNPKVYGVGAWRNPELQAVQQHLLALAGKEIPNHYK